MKVLVACEFSGVVREAFLKRGHDAWSCDLLPSDIPGPHLQCDVRDVLDRGWDMMLAFPPCTYLANTGARWAKDKQKEQQDALEFVRLLLYCDIDKIALENPVGIISTRIRKPDQIIQPWMFGHSAQKTTCLWLKNLPHLVPTNIVDRGEMHTTKSGKVIPKWYSNFTKVNRWKLRSITFSGIAAAMAEQWG